MPPPAAISEHNRLNRIHTLNMSTCKWLVELQATRLPFFECETKEVARILPRAKGVGAFSNEPSTIVDENNHHHKKNNKKKRSTQDTQSMQPFFYDLHVSALTDEWRIP